jgi:hypothetical protein
MSETGSLAQSTPAYDTAEKVVEFVRIQRRKVGQVLLGISGILLLVFVFFAYKGLHTPTTSSSAPEATEKDKASTDTSKPVELVNLRKTDYIIAALLVFAAMAVCLSLGLLLLRPGADDPAAQQTSVRLLLLAGGGCLGLILILAGMIYFYLWSDSLTNWLDKKELREARWVLLPLLMILLGSLTVLLAILPARAEERQVPLLRHLIYGSNFALTVLLLLVVLIVVNVVVARELPNQLDTTASGFYTLSEPTRRLLTQLDQPVRAYVVMPNTTDRDINDIRQLLLSMQDTSSGRFSVRFLSQTADRNELASLREKYPQFQLVMDQRTTNVAILLTTGTDEKRHAVVSDSDMFDFSRRNFEGEKKLYQEIAFLADNQNKPVVYFTQGHGEMDATNNPDSPPERSVNRLRQYLEKNYLDVRTLHLNQPNPKVPDDAKVLILAEPQNPYSREALEALRAYMNRSTNKGKIIYFSGTVDGPDGQMMRTGVEDLLAEFNVRVGQEYLYTLPTNASIDYRAPLVAFSSSAIKNPILQSIARVTPRMQFAYPREVSPQNKRSEFQATELLLTVGITWREAIKPADIASRLEQIIANEKIQEQVGLSSSPRSVATTVTEGATPRVVAIGSAYVFSDRVAQQSRASNPVTFDLIGVSVDWLRERETSLAAVNIEAKKYTEYKIPPPSSLNFSRLLWLPLGLGLLTVVGMGVGVWVVRRR